MHILNALAPQHAALIPVGCNEVVALILSIAVVGIILYFADAVLGFFTTMDAQIKGILLWIIRAVCITYICLALLWVIFGLTLFGIHVALVC